MTEIAKKDYSKPRAIRVLLRPGRHVLREAISMDENNTIYETYSGDIKSLPIAIETMEFSPELDHNMAYQDLQPRLPSDQSKRKLRKTIRNIFQCRNVDVESEDEDFVDHDSLTEYLDHPSLSSDGRSETAPDGIEEDSGTSRDHYSRRIRKNDVVVNNRAILVLTTRRHNEPLLRVRQGCLTIRNVDL